MEEENKKDKRETKELSLVDDKKPIMKFLVNPQIPESLSGSKDPKSDMISRTQSTDSRSNVSDEDD